MGAGGWGMGDGKGATPCVGRYRFFRLGNRSYIELAFPAKSGSRIDQGKRQRNVYPSPDM